MTNKIADINVEERTRKGIKIQKPTDRNTAHVECKGEGDTDNY
jgi:hypothetical protein